MINTETLPHSVILIQDFKIHDGPGCDKSYEKDTVFEVRSALDKNEIAFLSLIDPTDGQIVHIPRIHLLVQKIVREIL